MRRSLRPLDLRTATFHWPSLRPRTFNERSKSQIPVQAHRRKSSNPASPRQNQSSSISVTEFLPD